MAHIAKAHSLSHTRNGLLGIRQVGLGPVSYTHLGPRYAQVLQSGQQEVVHHFIFSGYRLDEFGMLINVLDQPVGVFAHTEEIGLFFGRLHRPAAVGAFAVYQLGLGEKCLAGSAVTVSYTHLVFLGIFRSIWLFKGY